MRYGRLARELRDPTPSDPYQALRPALFWDVINSAVRNRRGRTSYLEIAIYGETELAVLPIGRSVIVRVYAGGPVLPRPRAGSIVRLRAEICSGADGGHQLGATLLTSLRVCGLWWRRDLDSGALSD